MAKAKHDKKLTAWATNNNEKRNVRTLLTTMHVSALLLCFRHLFVFFSGMYQLTHSRCMTNPNLLLLTFFLFNLDCIVARMYQLEASWPW